MMIRAVFLDRDGVINKEIVRNGKVSSPRTRNEFVIIYESVQAIEIMKAAGFKVIVVTNQPDITRGKLSLADLKWMTNRTLSETDVDEVVVCPHDDCDNCDCRKPKPGMLLKHAEKWQIDLSLSYIVGDSWRDMAAGKAAGCTCILIDKEYNKGVECSFLVGSLPEAAELIIKRKGGR